MKISCLNLEKALALTPEEKWDLVCRDARDDGESADVAILLGCPPRGAIDRAKCAAELYHSGRVRYIVASGGVEWEWQGEKICEADLMRRILLEAGVPDEAILTDNEARTTPENMMCSTLVISRNLKLSRTESVIIVTSQFHIQRSVALAKALLPRKFKISACPAIPRETREEWLANEKNLRDLDNSIKFLKRLVDNRVVEDVELDVGYDIFE